MDIPTLMGALKSGDKAILLYSFLLASVLAVCPGNFIVRATYHLIIRYTSSYDGKKLLTIAKEHFGIPLGAKYHDAAGTLVGSLEVCLYVFAIMFGQAGVITAVIILKAFFGWALAPAASAHHIQVYYVYIIGNLLSLMMGIAMGVIGYLFFPTMISHALSISCKVLCF